MARRLYLGRLPTDARSDDVTKIFEGYGRIVDCRVMTDKGFGFVEFENPKDAEEVVHNFNGKSFMGSSIIVEFAKESRRREPYDGGGRSSSYGAPPPRRSRPPGHRISVGGISRDTSWQDLKDFGREAGNVSFADVDRDAPGNGVLEYHTLEDAEHAVKTLDGKDLRGVTVRVTLAEGGGGGGDYTRDRRSPPRHRSRSPRRDDRERRRSRSPRRRDYDDRRDDPRDRRGGGGDRDYRRDDYRRDDRREERPRDEKDGAWGSAGAGAGGGGGARY